MKDRIRIKVLMVAGIILFFLSYSSFLLPERLVRAEILVFFHAVFDMGIIMVCESMTLKLRKKSLVGTLLKNRKNLISFVAISTLGGIILESVANWSGKLWIYPNFGPIFYLFLFIPIFIVYWLAIVESYLAVKAVIDYKRKGKEIITKPYRFEKRIYNVVGFVGLLLFVLSLLIIYFSYLGQSAKFIGPEDITFVSDNFRISFSMVITLSFAIWFILEFIEHKRKKNSLIKDIVHDYFSPILSIFLGASALAFLMETQNLAFPWWLYVNWPYQSLQVFGLPILIFLCWPLHYVIFLSLFRAFSDEDSDEIWRGDLIK
ncbi:MAG: hypothetical protein ABIF84_02115 [Patescibacteria group bacterium]